jgi:hypothetical protein
MGDAGDFSSGLWVQVQPAPNLDREVNKTNQLIFGKEKKGLPRLWIPRIKRKEGRGAKDIVTLVEQKMC